MKHGLKGNFLDHSGEENVYSICERFLGQSHKVEAVQPGSFLPQGPRYLILLLTLLPSHKEGQSGFKLK